ncbi:hypothetical protein J0383_03860 [Flavobacterium endoglycinae]|uniref:DUF4292 domain-containing protein n=1 Tax=Flavobacterium endoglycinae TaxID=2816357 RepID=A0ABX7QHA2_9FLAO|nr:hypothetical protein [Flavobacterium endoglycinae]QSW89958.1 hypothetical protein J0383_03860 [Flavobacterium endoglycinae]
MKNLLLIFLVLFFTISCKNEEKKYVSKNINSQKLDNSKKYLRSTLNINYSDATEEIELYISKKKDTISNQYKLIRNNKIDTLESCYYDLKISKSNKPNFYRGVITLHTKYENLKLNKKNKRTIDFGYCNQNKDSVYLKYITSKNSTTLNFEFENYKGANLNGILYQLTQRDTTKDMINLNQVHLLVDNLPQTNNFLLESYNLDKDKSRKINLKEIKLKKTN